MNTALQTCLWPACVKTHSFERQVDAAVAGGFDTLAVGGLTYRDLVQRMSTDDICALAGDRNIALGHYDGFTDWAPVRYDESIPDQARAVFDFSSDEVLDICAALGLNAVGATGAYRPERFAINELGDSFGSFCQRAARYGLRVDLEFIPFWGIPDLRTAHEIIAASGVDNAGILFDTWHFCRGTADFELLEGLPTDAISAIQVAGGYTPDDATSLIEECLTLRTAPGDGDLVLEPTLALLARQQKVQSIGPEVFSAALDTLSPEAAARDVAKGLEFSLDIMAAEGSAASIWRRG